MSKKRIKSVNNIGLIIVLGIIVMIYASYFLLYIPQQKSRVQERGFRILEEYAENIHKKKDYYQSHLRNYGAFYAVKEQNNYENLITRIYQKKYKTNEDLVLLEINGVVKDLDDRIKIETSDSLKETDPVSFYDKSYNNNISFNLENPFYKERFENAIQNFQNFQIQKWTLRRLNVVRVPITAVMENLKFDRLFENIAFLDASKVIHNSNGSVVNDITSFEELKDTINKTQGGVIQTLDIRGIKNHVLILPITFLDQKFYVAGFITDQAFKKKTRTINSQLLTILSGIILLLLIGMPVLKIIFINRKERLNVRDAHNSTVSFIIGISLLILLFIGTIKYYAFDRNNTISRVEKISDELTHNIIEDFKDLYDLADKIIEGCNNSKSKFCTLFNSEKKYEELDTSITGNLFPFNEIIFIDNSGTALKAFTTTSFSNLVTLDLSNRNYFKKLEKENTSWPLKNDYYNGYFVESIKSYNTGFKETAVSFRLNQAFEIDTLKAPYLAITSQIPSLYEQVLPEDVAFLVIDKAGEVLFHSDQSKNLQENFLIESNQNPRLQGAIKYRTSETVQIVYNEQHWFARIVPMKDKPLYHVTLIDLNQTNNKNTRIYLFTFYFLLITFGCIVFGMQIFQHIGGEPTFMKTKTWSFKWLVFREDRYWEYVLLLFIQSIILSSQIIGLLIITKPFEMLFYQILFIALASFAAYIILNKKQTFSTFVSLIVVIGILLLALRLINCPYWIIAILVLLVIFGFWVIFQIPVSRSTSQNIAKIKNTYFSYMFIWLMGISVIPVIGYYFSITHQEEILANRNNMIYMAHNNLLLNKNRGYEKQTKWHKRIDGEDITGMEINYSDVKRSEYRNPNSPTKRGHLNPDSLYFYLPSPITRDDYFMSLLKTTSSNSEWFFSSPTKKSLKDESLHYTLTDAKGGISIKPKNINVSQKNNRQAVTRLMLIILPLFLLLILVWSTFRFLSDIVLGTIVARWKTPKTPSWEILIKQQKMDRIILISFDGRHYLKKTESKYETEKQHESIKAITAEDLFDDKTKVVNLFSSSDKIIWLTGLGEYLLNFEKSDLIISRLKELNKITNGKLIIELPYDSDFIEEYFEDYMLEFEVENDVEIQIYSYVNQLRHIFKEYHRFTGSIDKQSIIHNFEALYPNANQSEDTEEQILANAHLMKLQYSYIWNNISRMEKMILFDLADDGMLNFKNRFLINRLRLKGLIEMGPHPKIFTSSFQYFLKYSIKPEETQLLENKLSKQGKWKNTRYMILLILIPLAGFVFISQGTSIEKVIGIFTGVLALLSGAMRVMDSGSFMRASEKT